MRAGREHEQPAGDPARGRRGLSPMFEGLRLFAAAGLRARCRMGDPRSGGLRSDLIATRDRGQPPLDFAFFPFFPVAGGAACSPLAAAARARRHSNLRPSAPQGGRSGRRITEIESRGTRGSHWAAGRPDSRGTNGTRRLQELRAGTSLPPARDLACGTLTRALVRSSPLGSASSALRTGTIDQEEWTHAHPA